MTLVSTGGGVDNRAVVPHGQHIFGPSVTVHEFFFGLMGVQEHQQLLRLGGIHSFSFLYCNGVARAEEQCRSARFWMALNQWMILGG